MRNWSKAGIYSLLAQIVIYYFLIPIPGFVDNFIIPYIFNPVSGLLRTITGWIPFSVGLVGIFLLIGWVVYKVGFGIWCWYCGKNILNRNIGLMAAILSGLLFFYMITWGFLYYRQPVVSTMNLDTTPIEISELSLMTEDLINVANDLRRQIRDSELAKLDFKSIEAMASGSFDFLPEEMIKGKFFFAKKATGSKLLAYMGTAGIYTFWSGEANVNKILAPQDIPNVMLHEMAHQIGFASEDEASFIAWMAGKNHPDKLIRYSVTSKLLWQSLNELYFRDSTVAAGYSSKIDSAVVKDQIASIERWAPYRNVFGTNVISPIYNTFLKANGEEEGLQSYNRIVDLAIFERRQEY